jgi:hypothetical protein
VVGGRLSHRALTIWILGLSAVALTIVWIAQPGNPPIYDGLPLGTPPYRYLVPPADRALTAPPSGAAMTFQIAGTPYGFQVNTSESVPQASVIVPVASLVIPPGATRVTVSVRPVLPPSPAPLGSTIDGNVYRIEVSTGTGQPVAIRRGSTVRVMLRHTGSPGRPNVAVYTGSRWRSLTSVEDMPGISTADSPQLGDLTLLTSNHRSSGLSGSVTAALVVGAVLVVMALLILVIGRARSRRAETPGRPGDT